jgi:ribose 5-phosphate isomerase
VSYHYPGFPTQYGRAISVEQSEKKFIVAKAALEYIEHGCVLGVGTGSTVNILIDALPSIRARIHALVSSSEATAARLEKHGFEVSTLNEVGDLDLYVDGADEATKHLHLVKGGGGALTREKVLAGAARRFVCIVDDSKLVGMLGRFPLPIEVLPMAQSFDRRHHRFARRNRLADHRLFGRRLGHRKSPFFFLRPLTLPGKFERADTPVRTPRTIE